MEPGPLFQPDGLEESARVPPHRSPPVLRKAELLHLEWGLPRWWVEWPVMLGSGSGGSQ